MEAKRVNFLMRQGIFLKGIPAVRSRKVTPYHQKSELCSPKIGLQTCSKDIFNSGVRERKAQETKQQRFAVLHKPAEAISFRAY